MIDYVSNIKEFYKTKVLLSMPSCLVPIGTTIQLRRIDSKIIFRDVVSRSVINYCFKVVSERQSISGTEINLDGKYLNNYVE